MQVLHWLLTRLPPPPPPPPAPMGFFKLFFSQEWGVRSEFFLGAGLLWDVLISNLQLIAWYDSQTTKITQYQNSEVWKGWKL